MEAQNKKIEIFLLWLTAIILIIMVYALCEVSVEKSRLNDQVIQKSVTIDSLQAVINHKLP